MCQRVDFFLSGTCDEPLVWNSSKRQTERQLWYHFYGAKNNLFSADRPLEHVGWLTDKIAVKGKNRDICNISFSQSKCDKQSLRFKLLFNIWIHSRFHGLMHMEISRVQFFLTSFKVASLIFVISVCRGW